MSDSKATVWLIAALMLLSMGAVLYPQGSARAATFCAQAAGTAGTGPDCTFSSLKECRASLKAKGGGRCYKQKSLL